VVATIECRRALASLLALASLAGCASSGARRAAPVEVRDATGFSLTETARVPGAARSDFERANLALAENRLDEAVQLLTEVTEAAPDLTAPWINLGLARARQGELAQAETAFAAALERSPRHPAAHNELGIVLRRSGRFADARAHFEAALAVHPDFHYARKNLAILCDLYLADAACALEHYRRYRAAVPGDEQVEMWIADLEHRSGS